VAHLRLQFNLGFPPQIRAGLRSINIGLSEKDINLLAQAIDTDGDGEIDYKEFVRQFTVHGDGPARPEGPSPLFEPASAPPPSATRRGAPRMGGVARETVAREAAARVACETQKASVGGAAVVALEAEARDAQAAARKAGAREVAAKQAAVREARKVEATSREVEAAAWEVQAATRKADVVASTHEAAPIPPVHVQRLCSADSAAIVGATADTAAANADATVAAAAAAAAAADADAANATATATPAAAAAAAATTAVSEAASTALADRVGALERQLEQQEYTGLKAAAQNFAAAERAAARIQELEEKVAEQAAVAKEEPEAEELREEVAGLEEVVRLLVDRVDNISDELAELKSGLPPPVAEVQFIMDGMIDDVVATATTSLHVAAQSVAAGPPPEVGEFFAGDKERLATRLVVNQAAALRAADTQKKRREPKKRSAPPTIAETSSRHSLAQIQKRLETESREGRTPTPRAKAEIEVQVGQEQEQQQQWQEAEQEQEWLTASSSESGEDWGDCYGQILAGGDPANYAYGRSSLMDVLHLSMKEVLDMVPATDRVLNTGIEQPPPSKGGRSIPVLDHHQAKVATPGPVQPPQVEAAQSGPGASSEQPGKWASPWRHDTGPRDTGSASLPAPGTPTSARRAPPPLPSVVAAVPPASPLRLQPEDAQDESYYAELGTPGSTGTPGDL
jgi:uncharacterized coiled-coil protein SlyX